MRKLNILSLSTTNAGGGGITSRAINEMFNRMGHHALLVVKESRGNSDRNVIVMRNRVFHYFEYLLTKVFRRIRRMVFHGDRFDPKYCFYNTDEGKSCYSAEEILNRIPFVPDVIFVHYTSNFVNTKTIRELGELTNAKIFWLTMDHSPLTGGCHFPWSCKGFRTDCTHCPAILKHSDRGIAEKNLRQKNDYLPDNSELIVGSEGDYQRAIQSALFGNKPIHKIMAPVDEGKYAPADKTKAKQYFGINPKKRAILYASMSLHNIRKGGAYFLDALSHLEGMLKEDKRCFDDYVVMVAGKGGVGLFSNAELPIAKIGYLCEDELVRAYQAADIYVSPCIEDAGPMMVNQSILCGTPVVAFEMGVAIDLVITGQTGYLAKLQDSEDLARGIKTILDMDSSQYARMSNNCRELGVKLCRSDNQINAYVRIFEAMPD